LCRCVPLSDKKGTGCSPRIMRLVPLVPFVTSKFGTLEKEGRRHRDVFCTTFPLLLRATRFKRAQREHFIIFYLFLLLSTYL
jgi:hypothetical protein